MRFSNLLVSGFRISGTRGPLNGSDCLSHGESWGRSFRCCSSTSDNILLSMKYCLVLLFLAFNAFGQTFPSNTPTALDAPIITELTVTRYTMTVIWTEDDNAQSGDWQNGYYTVSYLTLPGGLTGVISTNNTLTMSATFISLTPGTTYNVVVQYFVPSLNLSSPVSNTATITTWP